MTKARLVIILIAAALVVGAIVIAVFAFTNAGKHQSTPAAFSSSVSSV
ncbi:MAG: hypothetical protein KKH75_05295 [Actinobacteria bacterium]|nr:hypothetical protein [Actinomycetota bacterium]